MKYHLGEDVDLAREEVRLSDGTRLSEELAAEIAVEALVKARRGRRSLTAPGKHSPAVSFRVPEALRATAVAAAAAEGRPVSSVARQALEEYLAAHAGGR